MISPTCVEFGWWTMQPATELASLLCLAGHVHSRLLPRDEVRDLGLQRVYGPLEE